MEELDAVSTFTSFLFGNIDETGALENDFLDDECKKHLASLAKLGLNPLLSEIIGSECSAEIEPTGTENVQNSTDSCEIKSPSAIDFSDILEVAHDESELDNEKIDISKDDAASPENIDKDESKTEEDKTLMPPPLVPFSKKVESLPTDVEPASSLEQESNKKKLETPLAGILPKKYADVDVKELFPDFHPDKVLRFSRLFGNKKSNSSSYRWKLMKKKKKKKHLLLERQPDSTSERKVAFALDFDSPPSPSQYDSDDENVFLKPNEESQPDKDNENDDNVEEKPKVAYWRYGPAQLWYDMLNIPDNGEGFDYGFKLKPKEESTKSEQLGPYHNPDDDAFLMVSQTNWEDDIIWDGESIKHKVLQTLNSKTNAAGWIPTSSNRIAQTFSQPGKGVSSSLGGNPVLRLTNNTCWTTPPPPTPKPSKNQSSSSKQQQQSQLDDNNDDTWYSIFPVENEELIYGTWEDDIIWDAEAMDHVPKPKMLTLDPNDENIILGIPNDIDPSKQRSDNATPTKVKIPHPHVKKSKLLLGKAGVINVLEEDAPPSPEKSPDHDPFNISNDKYYTSRSSETSLKVGVANLIQHSTPVVELKAPFVQTHMGPMRLRNFHRPLLKRYSHGILAHPNHQSVIPLTKYIKKKAKQREQERIASGGGDIFFMRNAEDLTGRDGDLVLMEFCEEHPPLINLVGMCSKIKNYYKRKAGKDQGPPEYKYGEVAYAHTSPFLGMLMPGKSIQAVENNMYRAPIYEHTIPETDFLVIRTRNQYFIREINALFVAGQLCPLYEVPSPNSKRANNFVRDFLQVFIYRQFWRSKHDPKRICIDEVRKAFPTHSESSIRKRLKMCSDFKRTGHESNLWVIKQDFRLPPEEEIRAMVSPEQCCAYFSMIAAEQRLKDAGYGEKFLFTPQQDDDDDDLQLKMDDEIKVAPWNTTRAYIQAMKSKCLLQLTGPADPTGCGEGFSYVRVPNKPITRQSKEEQKSQPKRIVTGTDADLRRLSLNNAKALLRKFGVPEEEIKKLSRWEVIDVVRTLSTEKAKAGEEGMTKFSRGNRFSIAEHQERYKEECQRIFDLQNRVLSSNEILSTDEDESSDEDNGSDIEEMGKNIENMLSNKKTSVQLSLEKEEQERQELRKMIMGENSEDLKKAKEKKKIEDDNFANSSINQVGRVLKIYRTFRDPEGKEYTRLEVVRKSAVIDAYVKIRSTKNEDFIKQFALLDEAQKEEMKREKRRIQEQLRRIKRNQQKDRFVGETKMNLGLSPISRSKMMVRGEFRPNPKAQGNEKQAGSKIPLPTPPRRRPPKLKPDLKVKCGACGATGHMRTNKACPLYQFNAPPPPVVVALTEEQEEEYEKQLNEDVEDLVNVDGTKMKLSSKLIKHAEDVKRRSLLLKVPKDALNIRKRKATAEDSHCDYLTKYQKPANRRCTDPLVALSTILEAILNEMRHLPDVQPFLFPVNAKAVPDYYKIVSRPIDLQTMRENLRQKKYQTREEFLSDVNQIVKNSTIYNGAKSILTLAAEQMLQVCVNRLAEKEDRLMRLEKSINPLLDDNDQVALSFILGNILSKIKNMSESWPFAKPVNKRAVKDYYEIVKKPIDLETINNNISGHKYHSRNDFLNDLELIHQNCIAYNGKDSSFTQKAHALLLEAQSSLEEYDEHLSVLEQKLRIVQDRALEEADVDSLSDDGQIQDNVSTISQQNELHTELDLEDEMASKDYIKVETQQLLEDDLHCSSEDDIMDEDDDLEMMEEVKGIEIEMNNAADDESQAAEAMIQLGNFAYRTSSNQPSLQYHQWADEESSEVQVEEETGYDSMQYIQPEDEEVEGEGEEILPDLGENVEESSLPVIANELDVMSQDLAISDSDEEANSSQIEEKPDIKLLIENTTVVENNEDDDNDGLWF